MVSAYLIEASLGDHVRLLLSRGRDTAAIPGSKRWRLEQVPVDGR